MIVTIIEPATRRSITTATRYRSSMPDVEMSDDDLERLIARATAQIERYCDRMFARQRIVEETTGSGLHVLTLSATPVIAVHAVSVNDVAALAGSYQLTNAQSGLMRLIAIETHEYMWRALGGPQLYDRATPSQQRYAVEYTGGYVMPDDFSAAETVPADLEYACQLLVRGMIEAKGRTQGLRSQTLGDASWSYDTSKQLGLAEANTILDFYRRLVV